MTLHVAIAAIGSIMPFKQRLIGISYQLLSQQQKQPRFRESERVVYCLILGFI
jgi:hypothetical protein